MKSLKKILTELNYILTPKQKRQYVLVCLVALVGSIWELLGVSAILPLMETVMKPEESATKWYTRAIGYFMDISDSRKVMTVLGIIIIIIYVIKNLYLMFSSYIQAWYSTAVQRDLSLKMADTYLRSSYLFHVNVNSSILIRTVNQDVVGVFAMCFFLFRMIAELFTCAAISIYIIVLDPILAVSLVGILGLCMLFLFKGMKKIVKLIGVISQECEGQMLQYLSQAFNGIKEIMVMNRQKYFLESFEGACSENARAAKKSNFLNVIPMYVYEVVCIGGLIAIVVLRLHMVDDTADYITKLAGVAMAAFRLFPSVGRMTTNVNAITYNRPRLDAIYDMLRQIEDDKDNHLRDEGSDKGKSLSFNDALKINNISFKYPTGHDNVLDGLSLTIKKGESVALIGPSGAGKTTLADVILGLLPPDKGNIEIDGEDVYSNLLVWSKLVGYVPQSVYLTDDTIRANVAFGIRKEDIDEEKVWHAVREAQLEDFVKGLENGLDSMVGESGVRISGGQRQRIAIARALYENPEILVLDEATSALDTETETAVMEAIDSLHGSKTMIIVAHRLSTIRNCDSIYEISGGVAVKKDKAEVLKNI